MVQVLIRWAVQRGTSVLPKSTNPDRIASNLAVLDWGLTAADMAALSCLGYQARMVDGAFLLSPTGLYRYETSMSMHTQNPVNMTRRADPALTSVHSAS